jgi:tagatose 6-phosphate kinase
VILCLGTTPTMQRTMTFDRLLIDDVNRTANVHEYASGKSVNAARVAHTLGKQVIATGFVGGDRGRQLLHDLDRAGIPHDFINGSPQTRLCTTMIDRAAGTATELIEETAAVEATAWQKLSAKLDDLRPTAAVVVCSGSLTPGAPLDLYAHQAEKRSPTQHIIIDGRGSPARLALRHSHFILKLNREELSVTTGLPVTTEPELHRAMQNATPLHGWLIVTLGAHGALATDGTKLLTIPAPPIKVASAIGSGDAFAAGLAVSLEDGLPMPEACRLAAACAAANTMTPLAGHVQIEHVRELREKITVRQH